MGSHGPTVDQQIEEKEWDQEQVEKGSGEVDETKESLFSPGENGMTDVLLLGRILEARDLRAELSVKSGAGRFDPLESLLNPGAIGEKVASLLVRDAQLVPDRGENEEEEEREGQGGSAEGSNDGGHSGISTSLDPVDEWGQQIGKCDRGEKGNEDDADPDQKEPDRQEDGQGGGNPAHPLQRILRTAPARRRGRT